MSITLNVVHREHVATRSYEDAVRELYAITGSAEEGVDAIIKDAKTREEFETAFKAREGSSGFMRFMVIDHGDWLTRYYDRPAKALLAIVGNPLVAITMLEGDVQVGLNVPTRILIREDADGITRVTYDLPSTLMNDLSPPTQAAAEKLDEKLVQMGTAISGAEPS